MSKPAKLNTQQQPKKKGYLECWTARPGNVLVDCDLASIEPHVVAEFSRDKTLWQLYGPNAVPNQDVYLHNGAHIRMFMDQIRPFYNPERPPASPEELAYAKKECKKIRSLNKEITLACIAENELIRIKGKGFVPIQDVEPGDIVWDGTDWVSCGGAVYRGEKACIYGERVIATRDHRILTNEGWYEFGEILQKASGVECIRPKQPRGSWAEVWKMVCAVFRGAKK